MKKIISILLFLFWISALYAQHKHTGVLKECSMTEAEQQLYEENPELLPLAEAATQELEAFTRNFEPSAGNREGEYVIPVVFHVVHDNGPENISYEQIVSCINSLNYYFNAENPSASNVHPAFQDIVANVGFSFALATLDPDGNCTNGVTRTVSETTYAGGNNLTVVAPSWDRSMYLNVWVCSYIASGAAAYSRRPPAVDGSFGATVDGIVCQDSYIGSIGTSASSNNITMSHEVGHWLNLSHTWGGNNDADEPENCNLDDYVDDTPNTIGWTNCNNLNGESCGSLDNIENFMEYSGCRKMFTLGQAARMEAALNSTVAERVNLWQPENLILTGVNVEPELCVIDFNESDKTVCVGSSIDFLDISYGSIEQREWTFEGGEPAFSNIVNPSVVYNTPGLYNVSLLVSDGLNSLETTEVNHIRVLDTAVTSLPFTESFEEDSGFNEDGSIWYTETTDSPNIDWEITDAAAYTGTQSVYVHGRQNTNGATEYLLSQTFDLSGVTGEVGLTFKYACAPRNANSNDQLRIWISRDCGNFWSPRGTIDGEELYTVSNSVSGEFVPNGQNQWVEKSVQNIVSVFWTSSFRIRFEFTSDNGNNIYIDDINLVDLSTPTGVNTIERFKEKVGVYPNPARDLVSIEIGDVDKREAMEINLVDLSGRTIKHIYRGNGTLQNTKLAFNVSDISNGIYFLEFTLPEGRFAEKIMVAK
jgi:PKD repeat protein